MPKSVRTVPFPNPKKSLRTAHPWDELKIGEAFFISGARLDSLQAQCSRQRKYSNYTKRFLARRCNGALFGEEPVEGIGVWRVPSPEDIEE